MVDAIRLIGKNYRNELVGTTYEIVREDEATVYIKNDGPNSPLDPRVKAWDKRGRDGEKFEGYSWERVSVEVADGSR